MGGLGLLEILIILLILIPAAMALIAGAVIAGYLILRSRKNNDT